MNKFIYKQFALFLTCVMVLSTVAPVFAATSTNDYSSHWAKSVIEASMNADIVNGYSDGTFKPDLPITRAEFFVIANHVFNFNIESTNTFNDVTADNWYSSDVAKAKAAGYIDGYPDGGIHPNLNISRQEVAVILSNLKVMTPLTSTSTYTDKSTFADWSKQAISTMFKSKIMVGYPDGSFKPENQMTRAEALVALNNLFNYKITNDTSGTTDTSGTEGKTDTTGTSAEGTTDTTNTDTISVESLTLDKNTITMTTIGDTQTVIARFSPTNASDKSTRWVSSDLNVATVANGVITAVGLGTASITAFSSENEMVFSKVALTVAEASINSTSPVELGLAGDYVILAKSGISTVPSSSVTGNIGVSPIDSTAITGFSLTMDATNQFATSGQITGKVFASDYTAPTPSNLTTAISNMETAYTDAAGRAADYTELHSGDLSGKTLTSGVYKWGTDVLINTDVTLSGGPNDIFIFQISKGITQASGAKVILTGGVQAKNIFWQTADTVSIGTGAHFEGIILSMTNITLATNSSINGRILAQTAVTIDASIVVAP
ncbi:MAG: ice-binding family protein [Acidaminobacteraceae bacterium]